MHKCFRPVLAFLLVLCAIHEASARAAEIVSVKLYRGWYIVLGTDPEDEVRSRVFGEYVSNSGLTKGRNALTYVCKKGQHAYLRFNLPPEIKHIIAVAKQDKNFRFTDDIEVISQKASSKWVGWYEAASSSVAIEFLDNNSDITERHFQLIEILSEDFDVKYGIEGMEPLHYEYLAPSESSTRVNELLKFSGKKVELQDRMQFLFRCLNLMLQK